ADELSGNGSERGGGAPLGRTGGSRRGGTGRADDRGARGAAAVAARGAGAPRRAGHLEAGGGFLRDGDPMSRYRFIEAESRRYSVTQLCRIAQVSRTAYYEWQDAPSERERDDAALTAKIRAIHGESGGRYGVPRVVVELGAQGHDVGRKRVARLMKAAGLRGRRPPRWVRTTTPEPTPPAIPDLVHGHFRSSAPDVLWVGDLTYIRTWE